MQMRRCMLLLLLRAQEAAQMQMVTCEPYKRRLSHLARHTQRQQRCGSGSCGGLGVVSFAGRELPDGLLGPMRESSLADGHTELAARMSRDGYVLLRQAVPAADVARARAEVFGRLAEVGEIRADVQVEGAAAGVVTGRSVRREMYPNPDAISGFWRSVNEGAALRAMSGGAPLKRAAEAVMGEPAVGHDYTYVRAVAPGLSRQTGLHCDHSFFGTRLAKRETLVTTWVAMTCIQPVDGGLFVVENSHRFDDCRDAIEGVEAVARPGFPSGEPPWLSDPQYLKRLQDVGAEPSRVTHIDWEDAPRFALSRGSRLLTAMAAYQPGDVVVFSQWLLHGALDANNARGRARLSLDVRFHAADGGHDSRYMGANPSGTGGGGYGELNAARPLNEDWHKR
jgi:ectoine hydroxylase-related dioxygenase (phytanoyl-CoA dioxygenase family)